jgi:ribosomal protein S18 acetylase RimI-like enzyme
VVNIRRFEDTDLDQVVELSLRTWEPVFASVREVLGPAIFHRLHPDWRSDQAAAVTSSCTSTDLTTFVAVLDDRAVGFVSVALNAYHERMGAIEIIGVDPDYQRRGVARALTDHALAHMRENGMDIAVVETGGDPGHAPARAAYAASGFTSLPIARYFQLLGDQ